MSFMAIVWGILGFIGSIASIYTAAVLILDKLGSYSWWSIYIRSRRLIKKIKMSGFSPDLVVGIGRSGAILGGILAGNLGVIPIAVIDRKYMWNKRKTRRVIPLVFVKEEDIRGKKILLVDAAPHTGETCKFLKDEIVKYSPVEVRTASLFKTKYTLQVPDFYISEVKKVKRMPWRFTEDYREDFAPPED